MMMNLLRKYVWVTDVYIEYDGVALTKQTFKNLISSLLTDAKQILLLMNAFNTTSTTSALPAPLSIQSMFRNSGYIAYKVDVGQTAPYFEFTR